MDNIQQLNEDIYSEGLEAGEDAELIQLVGLKLGEEEYAIDVLKIQEIIRTVEITTVPRTDSYVLGVMNLRGKVIPVIDLRVRFALEKMDFDKDTRIIVVKFETENIGFVVDEVTEVIRVRKSMVEPTPPLIGSIGQEYILGICKYEDRLIILLDIDSVVSDDKTIESDLRRKFLGTGTAEVEKIDYSKVEQEVQSAPAAIEEPPAQPAIENTPPPAADPVVDTAPAQEDSNVGGEDIDSLIAAELAKREAETKALNEKKACESPEEEGDIDALIAAELAKREAETKALNEKKAADEAAPEEAADGDIDALIAAELAKREAETMALNEKKAAEENDEKKDEAASVNGNGMSVDDVLQDALNQVTVVEENDDHVSQSDLDALIEKELKGSSTTEKKNEELESDSVSAKKHGGDTLFGEGSTEAASEFAAFHKAEDDTADEVKEELDPVAAAMAEFEQVSSANVTEETAEEAFAEEPEEIEPETFEETIEEESFEEVKETKSPDTELKADSIDDLKVIAKKIIEGEAVDLGIDLTGELGELLRLINDTKKKVDEVDPTLMTSKEQLPNVLKNLESVNEDTEEATLNLMTAADKMSAYYSEFIDEVNDIEDLIYKKDAPTIQKKLDRLVEGISEADTLGFGILQALEFQDITEQKMTKTIGSISDIGARIGALLGFVKLKQLQDSPEDNSTSQEDIDKLLADFGMA